MKEKHFRGFEYLLFSVAALAVGVVCVCLGSVNIPLRDTWALARGLPLSSASFRTILLSVRIPRVLCVALTGAALSLCGAGMQGLLRNPLADGSTLGVSSGASLGAAVAILLGLSFPYLPYAGTMVMATLFAFGSLALVLGLAYALDASLSTNSIILVGVVFSMFVSSLMSLLVAFSGEKMRSITFWTMGSLSGSTYIDAATLLGALVLFGGYILTQGRELNAFALGEENARHLGVHVKRVKLRVMICASALIGVCVSIGGCIGFVGLVVPHMTRFIVGPNHRRLLPAALFSGSIFLMLSDLIARALLRPVELPIGVVTSLIGAAAFVVIFYRARKRGGAI